MLAIILGLISAAVVTLLTVAVNSFFSFDLTAFSLFFIIPVGAIFVGAVACWGYFGGLLKSNTKLTSKHKWIGVALALVTFVAVQYGFYLTAYIDADDTLNYKMEGDHISNFYLDEDAEDTLNFFTFTKAVVDSRTLSFSNHGREMFNVEGNAVVNWIFYLIDIAGAMAGSVVVQGMVMGTKKYCDNCNKYMKQKSLFKFAGANQELVARLKGINNLGTDEVKALLAVERFDKGEHYDVHLDWCEECFEGYLQLKFMQPESKGKFKLVADKSIEIKLVSSAVRSILA